MYAFAYPGGYPVYGSGAVLTPSACEYQGFGYGASKDSESSKKAGKAKVTKELKKGKEKETKATAKAAKNEKKGDEKSKAKARHAREVDWPRGLAVTGCKDKTVRKIVKGDFKFCGENHGRPYYKRDEKFNDLDVILYYWDDRDGSDFSGWWFGPRIGGDQVWAYKPSKEKTPPESGWKVPYDGPVDESFKVKEKKESDKTVMSYPMWYGGMPGMPMDSHAAERQMQEYARLQQEDAKRRMEEEFQRQKLEEQMRREAERKRKEEARQKQEELRKKREAEKELQEQRIKEGKAVFLVRKAIQRLQAATPETMEAMQKEMEECLKLHLEETGSQKDHMQSESEKCIEQTKKRIEVLNEAKRKAVEKKEADEQQRKEMEVRAKELLAELSDLLDMAEKGVEQLRETAAPLETSDQQSLEEVEASARAVEAAGVDCKALIKSCMDFLVSNGPEMKEPPSTLGVAPATSELKQLMARCLSRINECTKMSDALLTASLDVRDAVARRLVATKQTAELEALFAKYDVDGDGVLSDAEVRAFARGLEVDLSAEVLQEVKKCTVDTEGVAFARFALLKTKLCAQKELVRDRRRKVLREARDKVRAGLRAQLDKKVEVVEVEILKAKETVTKVEESLPALADEERDLGDALILKVRESHALVKAARDVMAFLHAKIHELPLGFEEKDQKDVEDLLAPDLRILAKQVGRLELRLLRVENLGERFKSEVVKRQQAELFAARLFAVKVARLYAARRSLSIRQLFREMDANGDGEMDSKEFSLFFLSIDREILDEASVKEQLPEGVRAVLECVDLTEELLGRLFATVAESRLSEDRFCQVMRFYKKVVKEAVLTRDLKVTGENTIRRAAVDEVLEVLEGPLQQEDMKVSRIKARCIADDSEGWITVRGNDGLAYLQDWRVLFRVLRDVALTANFERPADPRLLEDEVEVVEKKAKRKEKEEKEEKKEKKEKKEETYLEEKVEEKDLVKAQSVEELFDDFDPESPEAMPRQYVETQEHFEPELLQHVDSPRHEDPDEGFRRLRAGELVEVLEWPANHLESGLTRMKVLALSDGAVGWITQTNADGVHFAEPH